LFPPLPAEASIWHFFSPPAFSTRTKNFPPSRLAGEKIFSFSVFGFDLVCIFCGVVLFFRARTLLRVLVALGSCRAGPATQRFLARGCSPCLLPWLVGDYRRLPVSFSLRLGQTPCAVLDFGSDVQFVPLLRPSAVFSSFSLFFHEPPGFLEQFFPLPFFFLLYGRNF